MASETSIANQALVFLGAKRITSLSDQSKNANVLDDLFDEVRDQVLAKHSWNFATKRAELGRDATDPAFDFQYRYTLPANWIRTISVHPDEAGRTPLYHKEAGGFIEASSEQVFLRYVARIEDANMMIPPFRRAFSAALARDASIAITDSRTMFESMKELAEEELQAAKSQDALGGSPETRPAGSWVTARFGWRNGGRW